MKTAKHIINCVLMVVPLLLSQFTFAQVEVTIDGSGGNNVVISVPSGTFFGTGGNITFQNGTAGIDNKGTVAVKGNWTQNAATGGLLNGSSGTVVLDGGNQTIGGSVSTSFTNLTLGGTGIKTLGITATVTATLNLSDRELATGTTFVTVTSTGNITTSTGFVSSLVGGYLARNTNSTGTYFFPVGGPNGGFFRPVEIQPATTTSNTFKVRFVAANPNTAIGSSSDITICNVNTLYYHEISQTAADQAILTMYFSSAIPENFMRMIHWQGAPTWTNMGSVTPLTGYGLNGLRISSNWTDFSTSSFALAFPPTSLAPSATAASPLTCSSFKANWNASADAQTYLLDVATDNGFTSMVAGYNSLDVGNVTSYNVTGLANGTTYFYRIRAKNGCGTSGYSGIISFVFSTIPSAVTATPSSFCIYANTVQLNASASNSTIQWYTVPTGGANFGTSASGANFATAPTATSTYYAEGVDNSTGCPSTSRTAVTATLVLTPTTASPIIGTTSLCIGATTNLTSPLATGGIVSTSGGYRIHTFLTSGSLNIVNLANVEVLVVAGGGGGGADMGGGGGGGGVLSSSSFAVTPGNYPVTVGAGGTGAIGRNSTVVVGPGSNGSNSVFSTLTAIGGGGGASGHDYNSAPAGSGGSGGGCSGAGGNVSPSYGGARGLGTVGQGFNGSASCSPYTWYPGGGGGAGGPGSCGPANGGPGVLNSILGANFYWGAGGGGAGYSGIAGNGGIGGAGGGAPKVSGGGFAGANGFNPGIDGQVGSLGAQTNVPGGHAGANTGSGGGGGAHYNDNNAGGSGASGIVVVRYLDGTGSGVWASSNPSIATVNPSTGLVTGVAAGTTTISFTPSNGICSSSPAATTITVFAAPTAPSASNLNICPGGTANLNATSAGNLIKWYTAPTGGTLVGVTASGTNLPVTPGSTTTYYAEAVSNNPYATGGTESTFGTYRVHKFTSSGTLNITQGGNMEVLVVAGGGGGGADMGGGGGAGGVIINNSLTVAPGSYAVTVGVGGTGAPTRTNTASPGSPRGTNGGNSIFSSLTAFGGGGGASNHDINVSPAGTGNGIVGSGGGCSGAGNTVNTYGGIAGIGTPGQGYNGSGSCCGGTWYPGGGGGAGGPGAVNPAHGGSGVPSAILGTEYWFGGGGGGSGYSNQGGNGGKGGGGGGAVLLSMGGTGGLNNGSNGSWGCDVCQANVPGGNAGANTGGGGGGGSHYNANNFGGNGGSGIVVVRYIDAGCSSSSRTPVTVTVSPPPSAPTAVTASPSSFCIYANSVQLNATSAGNTISWYTVPSGGSIIGSSASGVNFSVTPTATTTYYAEANTGLPGCISTSRTSVTATLVLTPTTASAIEGESSVCVGASTNLISPLATGGNITKVGGYRIHTFLSSGTLNIVNATNVEVLVVAGGGGGGCDMGGGGGGGGVLSSTSFAVTPGSYPVTVGWGGAGAEPRNWSSVRGANGGNSVFGSLTAIGGGGGASFHDGSTLPAGSGGSGGGASGGGQAPSGGQAGAGGYGGGARGTGTPGQGFDGAWGIYAWYPGGGGGAGGPGLTNPAHGGPGVLNAILGTPYYWGGGGGGSGYSNIGGNGGIGGGGAGAVCNGGCPTGGAGLNNGNLSAGGGINAQTNVPGGHAGANTGGGGGGGSHYNANNAGGSGGSGIVVVRYLEGTGSGVWSSSNPAVATVNSSTGAVTGVAAGTTIISFTPTNGICSSLPASKTIIVFAAPAAPAATATPPNICPGTSSNLNAVSAGNLIKWYSAATGGSLVGVTASSANLTVTPVSTTTYYAEAVSNNPYATSTGGVTESTFGAYRIHKFTSNGTINFLQGGNVEVLVVGGGGGGGSDMGGGGGGGGVIINNSFTVTPGSYNITVGGGGAGAPASTTGSHPTVPGSNGGNSSFSTLTAIGGGRGGVSHNGLGLGIHPGVAGGSGGGATGYNSNGAAPGAITGGAGTAGQGYRGGNQGNAYFSGGGGGAGGPGADGNNVAHGGSGIPSSILGTEYWFGGGGGGAGYSNQGGNGGKGGGGGGAIGITTGGTGGLNNAAGGTYGSTVAQSNVPGGNGGTNTGGGGGSGSHYFANNKGGDGGSGVVIVRYLDAGCSSPRTPVTVTFNPIPANPSSVTASASTFCLGSNTLQLNATAPGSTIYWYTVPTGGSNIGTSASGANFTVTPTATTTYYAEAFNGCPSAGRTPVTVTMIPTPSTPLAIIGTTTTCVGGTSTLMSPLASGGDLSMVGGYLIHKFTASGTLTFARETNVEVLVVGGGGGGGMDMGGGGGGGGVIYNTSFPVTAGSYPITIGAGGTGGPAANSVGQNTAHQYNVSATNGGNSVFSSLTAVGGGYGGSSYFGYTPNNGFGASGGSGGGSSGYSDGNTGRGGSGTVGQGNAGGGSIGQYYSGGGGGAGGPGGSNVANGGPGVFNAILGTGYYWAGGGGGAGHSTTGGAGGLGGGGSAPSYQGYGNAPAQGGLNPGELGGSGNSNAPGAPGGNGGVNTGSGGGGGTHYNSNNKGGDGGSGIVVVRYPMGSATGTWLSSNPSVATVVASTGVVTAVAAGTTTITYTAVNGICSSPSVSTIFTVIAPPAPPAPVSASPAVICPGGSTNISAVSAGNNIKWYTTASGGSPIGTTTTGGNLLVSPSSTTIYYAETDALSAAPGSQTFNYTGGMQTFTVPAGVTKLTIETYGAQGGNGSYEGGYGARMKGDFDVISGQSIKVLVGGQGGSGNNGGGGGGTFVTTSADYPLCIAGGGGGGAYSGYPTIHAYADGTIWDRGMGGIDGADGQKVTSYGRPGPSGGGTDYYYRGQGGAGGGGLTGNGDNGLQNVGPAVAQGGRSFVNGGAGGAAVSNGNPVGSGGFGGGGGGEWLQWTGGGGGGGYGGGGGGVYYGSGGGGGSYNGGKNQNNSSGVRSGHGAVVFTWAGVSLCPSATRTPLTVTVDPFPTAGTVSLDQAEYFAGQIATISSTAPFFNRLQYQWNTTGGAWTDWVTSSSYGWSTSGSQGQTLYVRAIYRSANGGNCETVSNVVPIKVNYPNVGWTGNSGGNWPAVGSCGNFGPNWCAGSGTETAIDLVQGVNYTVNNAGGTACSPTPLSAAYLHVWAPTGGTECGWTAIGYPAINNLTFNAPSNGYHIITLSNNAYVDANGCGTAAGHVSGMSAVLRYRQNTTIINTTSTAGVGSGTSVPLTYTLGGAHNNPAVNWSVVASTGSAGGTFSGNNFITSGAGTVTLRAQVGVCFSDVTITINSIVNNPGAIQLSARTVCPGTTVTADNVIAASTGTPPCAGPDYYWYYNLNGAGYVLWAGPTSLSSMALPPVVTNTPGNHLIARNSAFACTGQANNGTTLDIPLTVLPTTASTPIATGGTNSTCSTLDINWTGIGAINFNYDVSTDEFFSLINIVNNANASSSPVTVAGLSPGLTYYYRVRANGCTAQTPYSNTGSGTTLPPTPDVPNTISSAASSIGCSAFTANWPSSSRSTSYFLQIDNNSDFSSPVFSSNVGNVLSYTQSSGLAAGNRYYYRVAGVNVCGTSAYSGSVTLDMLPAIPPQVSATIGTAGCNSFIANWLPAGAAPANNATNYYIDVSTSASFGVLDILNNFLVPGGAVTSYTVSGLGANATYYYRVRGWNTCGGFGPVSGGITAVTLPPQPATPTLPPLGNQGTGIGCTFFTANWNSSAGTSIYYIDISTSSTFATTIRTNTVDASAYPNGAGGTFTFPPGSSADIIAREACESVYGDGNCSVGDCGNFTYYYQTGAPSCACAKPAGSYEFIYYNAGYTTVGQDYGGQTTNITTAVPFTRQKTSAACDANSWTLTQANLGTAGASATSFDETGLDAGVTYYYRVRAGNNCGTSSSSAISGPVTLLPAAPDIPASLAPGTPTCNTITANWGTAARASVYFLDISSSPTFSTLDIQNSLPVGGTTFTQTGLTAGVNYYYRVRGNNSCGTSAFNGAVTAPTLPATPVVPIADNVAGGCTAFTATWSASANTISYFLDIASDAAFSSLILSNQSVSGTSYNQSTGVFAGNTYYYRVRASNVCGTSLSSAIAMATMLPATPAANAANAPSALACNSFRANWGSSPNATNYFVDVATDAGFTGLIAGWSAHSAGNVLFADVTGLNAGTTYFYRVRASNSCGTAANSGTRSATTLPPAPGTPTAQPASAVGCNSFTANWTSNAPLTATAHFMDVSTTATFATFVAGWNNHALGAGTSTPVAGLTTGATYYYRVRANNSCGTSASSNTQTVTLDKVPVITSCPGDITLNTDASICDATVFYNQAIAIGPEAPTIEYSQASGTGFPLGNTTVYITATNDCGTDNCEFVVTVNDAEPPTIICPDAQFVELDGACYAELPDYTGLASAFDNCSTPPAPGLPPNEQEPNTIVITQDPAAGLPLSVGLITVSLTATDATGNFNTCSFDVFIQDNILPTPVVQDIEVFLDPTGNVSIDPSGSDVNLGTYDNCGVLYTSIYPNSFSCSEVGVQEVTYEVGDINGNVNTTPVFITVTDLVAPEALCRDVTVQLDETGNYNDDGFGLGAQADNGSTDACGISSVFAAPSVFTCAELGSNALTFEATDVNGNFSQCYTTVTVEDNIAPIISCPGGVTVDCDASTDPSNTGEATATDNVDACASASITYSDISGQNPSNLDAGYYNYTITRTWVATDGSGNATPCDQVITVQDVTDPTITCPADVTISCESDNTSASNGEASGTDICSAAIYITEGDVSTQDGDNLNGGYYNYTITRTWRSTDVSGNYTECDQIVTVQDVTDPTITCPADVTIDCEDNILSAFNGHALSTDNCSAAVFITESDVNGQNPDFFAAGHYNYTITRTWTSTDVSGNFTTCDQTITVQDVTSPSVSCPANTTVNCQDDNTSASNGVATGGDNCSSVVITESDASTQNASLASAGHYNYTITRTWRSTDITGNYSECDQTITVQDVTNPSVSCPANTTVNCQDDNTSASNGVATGGDNCSSVVITESDASTQNASLASAGHYNYTITRTWRSTDVTGNYSECDQTITVQDITNPSISCPANTTVNCQDDNTSASNGVATGGDNCSSAAITESDASTQDPISLNAGYYNYAITRTWRSTDVSGNYTECDQVVTVHDITDPAITCPADVTIDCEDNTLSAANGIAAGTDNCSATVYISESDVNGQDGNDANPGHYNYTIIRTWRSTDVTGNYTECDQTITVQDITDPTVTCPADVTVSCEDDNTSASNGTASGTDICSAAIHITESDVNGQDGNDANTGHYNYTIIRTWRSTDVSGNYTECDQIVTVHDITNPTVTCPVSVTVNCEDDNTSASNGAATGTDICSAHIYITESDVSAQIPDNLNPGHYNYTITRTWRSTDVSGNYADCIQTITVQDITDPTVTCPANTTVNCQDDNTSASNGVATGGDNCSSVAITQSDVNGQDANDANTGHYNYTITRTWRSTDVTGNFSECNQIVTVQDVTAPTVTCPADVTVNCEDDHISTATGVATGTDICSAHIYITESDVSGQDPNPSSPGHYNYLITRTWRSTDVTGNYTECDQIVTVHNTTPPVALTQPFATSLDASGTVRVYPTDIDAGSHSICGGPVTLQISHSPAGPYVDFFCSDVGPNTVYLYVTDESGNLSIESAVVTISDVTPPVAICQNITVQLDASGNASITAAQVDNGSHDACPIASRSVAPNTFTCSNVGPNLVTLSVTDVNSNLSVCNATVTVQDHVAPIAICKNIGIQLNALGEATITASQVNNGSNDACGIASLGVAPFKFGCENVGNNTVTLTVTDNNSNVTTCTANVLVEDKTPAIPICQNVTVQLNAAGQAFVTAAMINNGSNDACGVADLSANVTTFNCSAVGNNTVTLTVTDNNGNTSQCTSVVTVQDNIFPTALCKNATVTLASVGPAAGSASITSADVNNSSYDNCGIATMSVFPNTWGCSNIGANAVTLTMTDVNGHTSSCNATVQVVGLIPSCSIASQGTGTLIGAAYTGGVPTNIYIGYGYQSTRLQTTILNGTGQFYSWTCSNPLGLARLSCTSGPACSAPVFTPLVQGNYTFTVTITNNYGCVTTCSITICVLNVMDGTSGKVLMAHYPSGALPCAPGSACNNLSIAVSAIPAHLAHTCDHLGFCTGSGTQICAPSAKTDDEEADRAIEEITGDFNVRVHPNPFADQFHLTISSGSEDNLEIRIFDVLGQLIENRKGVAFATDITFGSTLSKGVYLVEVSQGEKMQTIRIVKSE